MIVTNTRYYCDHCKKEISLVEYEESIKITLRVDLPSLNGKCGECSGIEMHLCDECSEKIGVANSKEYHDYTYSKSKLKRAIEYNKNKMLEMFFKK